jgi:hypothetical protein
MTRSGCGALPLILLLLVGAAQPARASGDPLKSAACGAALAALQAAREAAPGASGGAVESRRQQAAQACLGGGEAPRRPSRALQSPVVVPPPVIAPPGPPAAARVPAAPAPPVEVGRPPVITSCDANGCWASDGSRLNRIGPQWMGPSGPCSVQGGLAYCP